jgi:serine/arginine repetitive matrix protein 2
MLQTPAVLQLPPLPLRSHSNVAAATVSWCTRQLATCKRPVSSSPTTPDHPPRYKQLLFSSLPSYPSHSPPRPPSLPQVQSHAQRVRTTTGSPLRTGLLNRASTTSSVASLRPYAERKTASPKSNAAPAETKKPLNGNEHLVAQHIFPWEDLNWKVSPIKKVKAPSPATRPTHKRTMSPPMPFDPPPVFQPLHPPKNRVSSNPKSTKSSPETTMTELRPSTPLDGYQPPQVPTFTFGERPNKILRHGPGSSDSPTPVFPRSHSRNKSSLDSNRSFCIPMASETMVELGLRGTMGSTTLPDVDLEDPESDIPMELQSILTPSDDHTDTLSFIEPGRWFVNIPDSIPNLRILVQATSLGLSLPAILPQITLLHAEPTPVFRAQIFHANPASGDSDVTSDEDTKESFDFTGEIRMLNEPGASERRSFVEQLESAFKTPARIDLKYTFPEHAADAPPVPALPVDVHDSSAPTDPSSTTDDLSTDDIGVTNSRDTIHFDDEEYCRRLSLPVGSPSVDIVRERPGNPLASSRNSRPSDGQLNRCFRFGGSPMPSQRSDNGCSEEVSEVALTLSDIIPPHSPQFFDNSRGSLVEEDSSMLNSIMAQANTVLPVASEVAVPEYDHESSRTPASRTLSKGFRGPLPRRKFPLRLSRTSFAGLNSFDEVRRGFERGPNRQAFYPPINLSHKHNNHDSPHVSRYPDQNVSRHYSTAWDAGGQMVAVCLTQLSSNGRSLSRDTKSFISRISQ